MNSPKESSTYPLCCSLYPDASVVLETKVWAVLVVCGRISAGHFGFGGVPCGVWKALSSTTPSLGLVKLLRADPSTSSISALLSDTMSWGPVPNHSQGTDPPSLGLGVVLL